MHFYFWQSFIVLLFPTILFAQIDSSLVSPKDSIIVIETDTSFLYVIYKPPLKIKNKIELIRDKVLPPNRTFFSIQYGNSFAITPRKAQNGCDAYTNRINKELTNLPSFHLQGTFLFRKERLLLGLCASYAKFRQRFTAIHDQSLSSENRFNYFSMMPLIGYWKGNQKDISFVPTLQLSFVRLFNYNGYITMKDSLELNKIYYLQNQIRYNETNILAQVSVKAMKKLRYFHFVAEPFISMVLKSTTDTSAPYREGRINGGILLGFQQKLN